MEAIEELYQLSDSMRQAASLLADEDVEESSSSKRSSTFLNVVAFGNVGSGKSAVLNSLIGHPILPTGENGATRAPISIDLQKDGSLSSKSIILQIDNKSQQVSASALRHSLQDRLSKSSSGKNRDEIYLKLQTSTAPPLKLIDLPGLDQRIMDESVVSDYAERNDAVLLVIVPAAQAPEIASSQALRLAKEYDGEGTRTVGVITKIDQAASEQKALAAVQALLFNQGPPKTADIPWVALVGQSVSIASAQSGSESSLETAWRAESESLKSILTGAPQSKLGRIALVDTLAQQILSISVLVNGCPTNEFPMAKGLGQGCSLSPILFNVVGELLHLMLSKAVELGLFQGFSIGAEKKKFHWVSWKNVCKPLCNGGLGVLDLNLINRALLGKWVWKFANEKESQWKKLLCSKYNVSCNSMAINQVSSSQDSWIWRGIVNNFMKDDYVGACLRSHAKYQVGNGKSILFWFDVWVGDFPWKTQFPRIYALSTNQRGYVADFENIGPSPPPLAELKAIFKGLEIFLSSDWCSKGRLIVESDCKSVVDWVNSPSAPIFFSSFVKVIVSILSDKDYILRLIPRSCNCEGDKLAKEGIGLQGKSQIVQDELVRLGEQMVETAEGTRAIALELCREFEDKFLQHIATGEGSGWKIVASFEGNFPNRIKQLPIDRHFDLNNVKRIVLEADGYQPYLISPEKGLRYLIKGVLELAKEPARLCVDEASLILESFDIVQIVLYPSSLLLHYCAVVHRVLIDIVSAAANATPGLGRYPPFKREVVAIASSALDGFKNEAKKMVVALVDMERAFVPPQHFIRLVQRRMERQRREEEIKNRSSKKGHEAEQAILNRAASPQPSGQQTGGTLKTLKEKFGQSEKEVQETPALKTAGADKEITAGFLLKKSAKTNGWSRRWFVLNEKTGKLGYTKGQEEKHFRGVIVLEECSIEEVQDEEEAAPKSSKDKKANGPDKQPSLVFKITSKAPYKTVLKAHSSVVLKAESMADKVEWMSKLSKVIQPSVGPMKGAPDGGPGMRQSRSDGSLDTMTRRPVDPEEELRWMSQEVRGYVEAVLNSLAANVPKAVVLCQVEKAKEDMLNQLYSSVSAQSTNKIEELLQEDQNVKRRRERIQKQSSLLSKLTRQLSIHDNRAASDWSDAGTSAESSPRTNGSVGEDWRSAFDAAAANSPVDYRRSGSNGPAQNGDMNSRSGSNSRRTPNRMPPAPPQSGSGYKY
ncbi:Dynamin-2B [Hibiscus syriacus]|uniref:dynamin GTPase n=1 Tax=Hibiscus syriacus TaxID=106335 RepID=A0A6A2XFR6_HIBSY|nr:Dynamin-2B [Hibiscus syriacus]